jgi:hypothetical protein
MPKQSKLAQPARRANKVHTIPSTHPKHTHTFTTNQATQQLPRGHSRSVVAPRWFISAQQQQQQQEQHAAAWRSPRSGLGGPWWSGGG